MKELSIVLPCLNEAETLGTCIDKAKQFLSDNQVNGEVVVSDNGSTDGSPDIAIEHGAVLVHVKPTGGYGKGLMAGISHAKGKYIIMGDSDDSYDFSNLYPFIEKLREGYDLVMGNRFKGGIEEGAMPFLHRYFGNPGLSFLGRLFFNMDVGDFLCGLRGFSKEAYEKMQLRTTGMEFASEMVVKAGLYRMHITEVPTTLSPDGRSRAPHLKSWRDGWRIFRFFLIYSPKWLFLFPGFLISLIGLLLFSLLLIEPIIISNLNFDVHTLVYAGFFILIGYQFIFFYCFVRIYSFATGLIPKGSKFLSLFDYFTLERGVLAGLLLALFGAVLSVSTVYSWYETGFGELNPKVMLRSVIPAALSLSFGIQLIFSSFIFSILGLDKKAE